MNDIKNDTVDIATAEFLKDVLVTKRASIKDFEEKAPNLKFDANNGTVWQFIILKSLEVDFAYLMPLANHLIDNNYYEVDNNMVKYAALNGFKLEEGLGKLQNMQDNINGYMKDFFFEEKMIITNEPAQNIYNLTKKIVNRAKEEDYNEVKEIFDKAGVDSSTIKLMQRPQIAKKSTLKM